METINLNIEKALGKGAKEQLLSAAPKAEDAIKTLHKGNGETVQAEVSVVTPTYSYGIMVYGVMLNNNSDKIYTKADKTLLM